MKVTVSEAATRLETRGLLVREPLEHPNRVIDHVARLLGTELPADLQHFYRERIARIGEFYAITPEWNEHVGWRTPDSMITQLLHANAVPIFDDGCGNLHGVDITPGVTSPAVYFFDHERGYAKPQWAAGSALGPFLLILADQDRAHAEGWPPKWELQIDPDLEDCPRAPAIWNAG